MAIASAINITQDSRDLDGDSEMASSVDSVNTDPDGAQAGTRTPTHHPQVTSAAAASELSPPGSQPQTLPAISTASEFKTTEIGASQLPDKEIGAATAAWKSRRAQEEFDRAMEHVVDTDFNLNEFGDPFDERDMQQKQL